MRAKTDLNKSIVVLIISLIINYLFIPIAYKATELDLGQIAYMMFVFFQISAFITGILSESIIGKVGYATLISVISFSMSIVIKYNIKGLMYVPVYVIVCIIGFYVALGVKKLIIKLRSKS